MSTGTLHAFDFLHVETITKNYGFVLSYVRTLGVTDVINITQNINFLRSLRSLRKQIKIRFRFL